MKIARFVLKLVAISLTAAAAVCCVIAYWDKISAGIRAIGKKLGIEFECQKLEYDDCADWEEF